ncbi:hypothetical protein FAM22021_001729 [Propionibacterium freudenreichii]|nr:hypothetical protein [Propionibacterium freudenreichii]
MVQHEVRGQRSSTSVADSYNYRLPTVLERCAPHFVLDHHKADSDAEACALIVAALQSNPELYARLEAHR